MVVLIIVAKPPPLPCALFVARGGNKKLLAVLGILIGKHSKRQYDVLIFVEISQLIQDLWHSLMLNKYSFSVQTGFLKFTQKKNLKQSGKIRCWRFS